MPQNTVLSSPYPMRVQFDVIVWCDFISGDPAPLADLPITAAEAIEIVGMQVWESL